LRKKILRLNLEHAKESPRERNDVPPERTRGWDWWVEEKPTRVTNIISSFIKIYHFYQYSLA